MAYKANSGDVISLDRNRDTQSMTLGVPLGNYTGALDPIQLWMTQPSLRTVIDFVAHNLASIPLKQYRRLDNNDRAQQRDTPVARALRRPAPGVTPYRLRLALMTDRLIYDRFVALIHEPRPGVLELHHIPAQLTEILTTALGQPTAVRVGFASGQKYDLPLSEVIFDYGFEPLVGTKKAKGYSTLYTLRDLAEELQAAGEYRRSMWKNGAQVPAVITRPAATGGRNSGWNADTRQRFLRDFAKYRVGGGRQGGIPLLEDGMKLEKVDIFSPSETQNVEFRQLSFTEAAAAFRVPPELIGARPGNFSNVAAYREQLYQDVLGGWVMAFEQAHDAGLQEHMTDEEYVEANVDAKLRASFTERTTALQSSVGAPWRTRNEARKLENLPAIEGGDDIVTPLNVLTGGLASPRDTAPKSAHAPLELGSGMKAPDGVAPLGRERQAFATALEDFWRGQAGRLTRALERETEKAIPPMNELLDWEGEQARLARVLAGRSKRIAEAGAWEILDEYNPEADGWDADNLDGWLGKAAETNAGLWTDGVRTRLAGLLTSGAWEEKLPEIAGWAVASVFATTWATQYAQFGRFDAASKSGLRTKTWRTRGANPRASHAAMDGETVAIDDVFTNGLRYPGDYAGGAEEVANCQCSVEYGTGS